MAQAHELHRIVDPRGLSDRGDTVPEIVFPPGQVGLPSTIGLISRNDQGSVTGSRIEALRDFRP
jgi:hypothetical protein